MPILYKLQHDFHHDNPSSTVIHLKSLSAQVLLQDEIRGIESTGISASAATPRLRAGMNYSGKRI